METDIVNTLAKQGPPSFEDEKGSTDFKEKLNLLATDETSYVGDVCEDIREIDLGEDGKERPIETWADWSQRLVSQDDDPSLPVWTFRLWFISIGLSCFGAVLGEVFVRTTWASFAPKNGLETFLSLSALKQSTSPNSSSKSSVTSLEKEWSSFFQVPTI